MRAPLSAERRRWWLLVAAFATVYVVWGSTYLAIAVAVESLPPFITAGARFLVAGGVLYAFCGLRGAARPDLRAWRAAAVAGGLLMLGGNGLVTWAEQSVPSGVAALVIATVTMWVTLLDWLFCGGARPTRSTLLGIGGGLAGVALLVGPALDGAGSAAGVAALVVSAVAWAAGTLYTRRAPLPASPLLSAGMQMLAGGALLMVVGTGAGEWARFEPAAVTAEALAAVAFLVVFGSLVAFSAYVWLVRTTSPTAVATYGFVNPLVAVLLGAVFLDEPVGPRVLGATALIVGAVALVLLGRRGRAAPRPTSRPPAGVAVAGAGGTR